MPKRGENIYKRKDGRWEGRYIKDHVNGRIRYGYRYARTYREVREKLAAVRTFPFCENKETEIAVPRQSLTCFAAVSMEWLESCRAQLKDSSIVRYTNILTVHLFPQFGTREISSITKEEVSAFIQELLFSGGRNHKGLAPKTVSGIFSVLKSIFGYAKQSGKSGVAELGQIPIRLPQKPMRVLSTSEQQILNNYLCGELSLTNLGILLCLYTGMRVGEICALKWEDISFEEQSLYVHKTMQRIQTMDKGEKKTVVTVSNPKSSCSIRNIPLPDGVFQLLSAARCSGNTYFLTGHPRSFVEPRTMQNRFKAVIQKCNIKDVHFHVLRHTFATRCVELGFDIKSLSEILGHASVNITLNRYVHPSMELKQQNMNRLSNLFAVR